MPSTFTLTFPCFIIRREDDLRFGMTVLPDGRRAMAVFTDANLAEMYLFERCWDKVSHRSIQINTPDGLARVLSSHVPDEVTKVVFNPNGVYPHTERIGPLVRMLQRHAVPNDTIDF